MSSSHGRTYRFADSGLSRAHAYLLPCLHKILRSLPGLKAEPRVFDLGCGNGAVANWLSEQGYQVVGVDPAEEGIQRGKQAYPNVSLNLGSAYDDLPALYGRFPAVVSLEVVEHVYDPRHFARTLFNLTQPGGHAVISTPYHGYFKNLVLAASGRMDRHYTALWDNGHIKFWSTATLTKLLTESGFRVVSVHRLGRLPPLARSMMIHAQRPATEAAAR